MQDPSLAGTPSSGPRREQDAPARRALLGLAACGLVFASSYLYWHRLFVHAVVPPPPFVLRNYDPFVLFYPTMSYARDRLLAGQLPLWNPYQLCGIPFFATQYPAVLYPPFLATLSLPPEQALSALMWFHLGLDGVFAFAFARALGARGPAALCAAAIFMFSGYALDTPQANNLAFALPWTPAAFFAAEKICRVRRARWAVLLGVTMAMPILVGGIQLLVYTLYGLGIYLLFRGIPLVREGRRAVSVVALLFGVAGITALGLAAAQLIPGLELMGEGIRTLRRLTPQEFVAHPYLWTLRPVFKSLLSTTPFDRTNVSVLALATASLAIALVARRPDVLGLLVAGAFALDFASGPVAVLYDQYAALPALPSFRVPARALSITVLALAALSALGLTALIDEPRWPRRLAMSVMAGAVCGVIAIEGPAAVFTTALWGAGFFALCWPLPRLARWGAALALAVWVAYLQGASQPNEKVYPADHGATEAMHAPARVFRAIEASPPWGRALLAPPWIELPVLAAKTGSLLKFPVVGDYEPLLPRLYSEYLPRTMEGYEPVIGMYQGELFDQFVRHPGLLDYLSVAYVVQGGPRTGFPLHLPALQEIENPNFSPWRVYKNPNAMPHAYLATEARFYPSEAQILSAMTATAASTTRVYLEGSGGTLQTLTDAVDTTRVVAWEPERVVVTTSSRLGGWLVLTDIYYPGWIAEVDGSPAPILRANYLLRAVRLAGGEHRVAFLYRPRSVRVGIAVSVATLVILLVGAFWTRRRPPSPRRAAPRSAVVGTIVFTICVPGMVVVLVPFLLS